MNTKHLLLTILFIINCTLIIGQTSLMSFNIRYNNPNDKENWWEYRKKEITEMINYYQPDILGIQEGLNEQVSYLDSALTDYSYVGVGRDNGKEKGEYTAIFFNTKKLHALADQTYWLSQTPDIVSVGWDASMERIATFGTFRNIKTNETIYVFNCHYDHVGKVARLKSSNLIIKLLEQKDIAKEKIIVMGDLNCEPNEEPIQILKTKLEDSFEVSKKSAYGSVGTFNRFDTKLHLSKRIDYIFTRNIEVESYINIDDRRSNNLFLSDHLPVFITIKE